MRVRILLITASALAVALSVTFLVLGSVFYWGNIIIFGARERGKDLFLFTIAFLIPSVWSLVWLGCKEKKRAYPGNRKTAIYATFLGLNGLAVVLGIVEIGFFIAMAVPGSYGPVYVLKEDGVQTHWRGSQSIESAG